MSGDFNTYRRAANHSILGLVFPADDAVKEQPHAKHALVGVFPWIVLLILFDQHRRERIEAMEAEAFAATDAA
ncbi:MAG: hypothetical protein AAFV77_11130, partial [Planctomycetota bacterium]